MLLALPLTALGDESRDALIVETILRIEGFDLAGSTKAQGAVTAPAIAFRGPGPHCFQCVANACRAAGETGAAETLEQYYT